MRIQHNIAALNSYRQLGTNNTAISKNLEKLSSGYKINRAGDDAAGLAISEKMRAQITGLETAQKNANDGISLVQTAEGALTEVHSMLNRMVELATQSSNGTYSDKVDRENLQAEVNSLKEEIDRISEGTNFNGINLLDGSLGGGDSTKAPVITADWGTNPTMTQVDASSGKYTDKTGANKNGAGKYTVNYTDKDGNAHTVTVDFTGKDNNSDAGLVIEELKKDEKLSALFDFSDDGAGKIILTAKEKGTNAAKVTSMGLTAAAPTEVKGKDAGIKFGSAMAAGDAITVDGKTYTITGGTTNAEEGKFADEAALIAQLKKDGYKVVDDNGGDLTTLANATITRDPKAASKGLVLQIGDTADSFNKITVSVSAMDTDSLGIAGIDIGTATGADEAIKKIKDAINTVSSTRGDLGAIQNRLEHTINNLGVTTENITSAESRIRDTDMADEMMAYTKNNILVQASQAMLAQANTLPQGVLQLLQ